MTSLKHIALFLTTCLITLFSNAQNKQMTSSSLQPTQSGYAPVNGLKLYYEIYGNGRPLVLIHGGGSTIGTSFGRIIPYLAKQHKLIAVELQAHGHTSDRDTPETFEQDANDVAALLKYLNIPKADIMGFSNGGHTTLQIGISHPEIVSRLIIVSAFYKRDGAYPWLWQGIENATLDNMPSPLKEAYLRITNNPAGLQAMFDRDSQRMRHFVATGQAGHTSRWSRRLPRGHYV